MKFSVKKIVIVLLFSSALLAGIVLLFFGIKDSVSLAIKTKEWFEAPGYFRECSVYNVNKDGKTDISDATLIQKYIAEMVDSL